MARNSYAPLLTAASQLGPSVLTGALAMRSAAPYSSSRELTGTQTEPERVEHIFRSLEDLEVLRETGASRVHALRG